MYLCVYLFMYEKVGILATGCRRQGLKKTQNVKKRRINAKTGSKLKEITMQKSAPKFWLPSFYKFFQV